MGCSFFNHQTRGLSSKSISLGETVADTTNRIFYIISIHSADIDLANEEVFEKDYEDLMYVFHVWFPEEFDEVGFLLNT